MSLSLTAERGFTVGLQPNLYGGCCILLPHTVLGDAVVQRVGLRHFGLAISRSRVQILLEATLRNNLRQVVYTYVPVTKQYNLVPAKGR